MGFTHTNSKGTKYYLHSRSAGKSGKGKLYFFSKKDEETLDELPDGYEVKEIERTGLPVLKKKE